MEKAYWTARQQGAAALAGGAVSSQARAIHAELARRYGVEAARCDRLPAALAPGVADGRVSIRPAAAMPPRPGSAYRPLGQQPSALSVREGGASFPSAREQG